MQLLIDHGSDPYMENKRGDDAFKTASFEGQDSILRMMLLRVNPPVQRWIDSYELHGACYASRIPCDVQKIFQFWKEAVEMRERNACINIPVSQPNPFYRFDQEVKTMEELEELSQNLDFMHMRAVTIFERIFGPHHIYTIFRLLSRGEADIANRVYRRGADIHRYALQLLSVDVNTSTADEIHRSLYFTTMYEMCLIFCQIHSECQQHNNSNRAVLEFDEVFEVLQMATIDMEDGTGLINSQKYRTDVDSHHFIMMLVLQLISLITKLEMNADQLLSFHKIVYRLVRCQLKTQQGQTLIHLSVFQCESIINKEFISLFQSTAFVEVLLECGANVNAVDNKHNTPLHVCSQYLQNPDMEQHHGLITRIAVVLVKNSAHVDMANEFGKRAADGLTSSLMEMNMMNFVSLKCLAANVILKFKIPYAGQIIASLESFVQVHGICA